MIKSAVRRLILNNATAATLLGSERIYPSRLPSKYVLPAIVITTISSLPQTTHTGNSGRVEISNLQLSLITRTESQLDSLERAVRTALDLRKETVALGSNTVSVLASFLEDVQDLQGYEYEKEDEIVKILDFSFIWR